MTSKADTGRTRTANGTRDTPGLLTTLQHFVRDTRAGATAIAAVALAVMTLGGSALVIEHVWLVDQRDTLKAAANAAGIAASAVLARHLNNNPAVSDDDLKTALKPVARRYVEFNLGHLPEDRYAQAVSTLVVDIVLHRAQRTVDVSAAADLGGTLLARHLSMSGSSEESQEIRVVARVESVTNPVEVVLAIDVSTSMWNLLNGYSGYSTCSAADILRGCSNAGREDARISIMKRAAKNLVAILGPGQEKRVAIGVVPWHTVVRLAPDAIIDWERAGWADYPTARVYGEPYVCKGRACTPPASAEQALAPSEPATWKGCLDGHRMGSVGTRASLPATSEFFKTPSENTFSKAFFPSVQGSAYECLTHPLPADFDWNICYHGRKYNRYNANDYDPDDPQRGCADENPVILPLSTDAKTIEEVIDALLPIGGRTYSALGVLWGQRLLDHSWNGVWGGAVHPVDPAVSGSEGLRKAIVLLTDGEDTHCGVGNEACANSPLGFSRADACTKVKEAGTEIFVVAAMHPDKVSDALGKSLRACSSESAESDATYAFLNNSTQEALEAAFARIATQLQTARRVH